MKIVTDTLLIFRRQMTLSLRNPAWVVIGLLQPILYFALFGPLLKGVVRMPGFTPGTTWQQFFVPALLVQLGMFGAAFVGFGIVAEWRNGVIERMRVTPANRLALLMGRVLRDVVTLVVQCAVLLVVGILFGLRAPALGVLLAFGFVVLLAVALASVSYATGLILKSEDALAPLLNAVVLPLMLLSGILLPMSLGPAWLDNLSRANPFRYAVDGMRQAFLGHYASASVWEGLAVVVALALLACWWGTATFRRENA